MQAYLNQPELKTKTIAAMQADIDAQRLVTGHYWENDEGCFVGCVIRGDDHMKFETQIGFPVMLARLADTLFESLETQQMRDAFAIDYLSAPTVGADLSRVSWQSLHWLLVDVLKLEGEGKIFDDVRAAIKQCADVLVPLTKGEVVDKDAARAARAAAARAAYAARVAADAAYADYAAYAAYTAAASAAYAAAYAVIAAIAAAKAAYAAADVAAYAADAAAVYKRMADKLVQLMQEATKE